MLMPTYAVVVLAQSVCQYPATTPKYRKSARGVCWDRELSSPAMPRGFLACANWDTRLCHCLNRAEGDEYEQ